MSLTTILTMVLKELVLGTCLLYLSANATPYSLMNDGQYQPTWESLDKRPLPKWYDEAKVGIFIHWGVFSVPSFGGEWFWENWEHRQKPAYVEFMRKNYPPNFTYQDFARDFTAEFFNPQKWAQLFQASGARYVVLTSKHHEGYTLWPSKYSFSWNSVEVGPGRNLVQDLAQVVRNSTDLKFGLYHSLYEWYNPLYLEDKANNFTTNNFVRMKTMPELYELVNDYLPEVIWSDGEWEAPDSYWMSKEFLAWLYNDSPVKDTVVTNDRWGKGTLCQHGGFKTCQDRYNPGKLPPFKWENCLTIDRCSWGYRRNADLSDYMTIEQILAQLVQTVSCGGNFLLNVGPTKDGMITPIYEERLIQLGRWLKANGEAIYNSKPWVVQQDRGSPNVWYTKNGECIYAAVLEWPRQGYVLLKSIRLQRNSKASMLGHDGWALNIRQLNDSVFVKFPDQIQVESQWVYVLKFINISPQA